MRRVLLHVLEEYNLALVLLTGVLCMVGTFAALNAFSHAVRERGRFRVRFTVFTALAGGMAIWLTQFVGILAFEPRLPVSYDLSRTLLSMAAAVVLSAIGYVVGLGRRFAMTLLGGAIVGIGIVLGQFVGMAALQMPAEMVLDRELVAVSILLGIGLGTAALIAHRRWPQDVPAISGTVLALAILSTSFTAMAAVTIEPRAHAGAALGGVSGQTLGILLAIAAQLILSIAGHIFMFERQKAVVSLQLAQERAGLVDELLQAAEERERLTAELRHQAEISTAALDNMAQGLSMYDADDRLVTSNRRYADLYGIPPERLQPGTPLATIRELIAVHGSVVTNPVPFARKLQDPHDADFLLADGRIIELRRRPLPGGGWVATHEDVTEARRSGQQIAYLAAHDTLTGLPNRATFAAHLDAFAKGGQAFALHTIDLDRFKEVNDTLGHPVGDEILRVAAARLRELTGRHDIVTRQGGDEFAVIQTDIASPTSPEELAARIVERLSEPFEFEGHTIVIGASVGISLAPKDGTDADELLKMSDLALYCAKEQSRGTFRFFEAGMDSRLSARRQLEADLRVAIAEGQFEVHYQPLLDMAKSRIGGFEALVRWHHPTRGLISPADFIATAEDSGLIIPIGEWVLRQACRDAASWPEDVRVAVNVSPAQFKRGDLIAMTVSALTAAGLDPSRLELEITEAVLLHDEAWVHSALQRLSALGVRIAMDDFGTGYSSLSYLRSFPFNKIKIDRSFVSDLVGTSGALSIVQATIQLSQKLGMEITAEGVETAEQLQILADEGCTQVQGYHVSRPVPLSQVDGLLGSYNGLVEARARAAG